jgi:hypothetical protein
MAFEPFGLVGGLSVGIPPILVINDNGVATLNGLQVTGLSNLGPIGNVIITGGENGYFLQTDGAGHLTWAPGTGGNGGNGIPGGANTQVQFNNAGNFGGDAGFTYDSINNVLSVSGNIVSNNFIGSGNITIANINANGNVTANYFIGNGSQLTGVISALANVANYAGNITVAAQPNITSVGTLTALSVSGNVTANYFIGNGSLLTGIGNANYAPNANFANFAGNVTVSSQPNITSVGTLTTLSVSGNASVGNLLATAVVSNLIPNSNVTYNLGNSTNRWNDLYLSGNSVFLGEVTLSADGNSLSINGGTGNVISNNLSNVPAANVIGQVSNALVSSTVYSNSQPNITSVGTLISLAVTGNVTSGNVSGGNLVSANYLNGILTASSSSQPNIHTVGSLGYLNVDTSLPGANGNITFNGSMIGNGTQSDINITGDITAYHAFTTLLTGTLTTDAQPNVTSLGTLIELNVNGPTDLGLVGNITIDGGSNGYVLSTDGSGNLSWVAQSGGGGNGTPGGSNTQIQFNDGGAFGGNSALTFNNTTKLLRVDGNLLTINNVQASVLVSNVATGTAPLIVTSTTKVANLSVETANTATFANTATNANVAITVSNAAQPNITSVGNLTSLNVTGNILVGGRGNVTGNLTVGNLDTNGTIVATTMSTTGNSTVNGVLQVGVAGSLKVLGNVNTSSSSNVFLGNVENIHISGGVNGYLLSTDGAGNLTWSAGGGGGGNGTPGGSNTQIQYNDAGAFGGSAFLTFNEVTNTFQIAGNLIANSTQIGAGVYKFSTQYVYFATTTSTTPDQLLWSTPSANVSGVDFHIIATDTAGSARQSSKISALVYGSNVVWNEYGSLQLNGGTGSFSVEYEAGGIITPSTIKLIVTPDSANSTTYNMMITEYAP